MNDLAPGANLQVDSSQLPFKQLRILSFNAQGLYGLKRQAAFELMDTAQVDVACFQETHVMGHTKEDGVVRKSMLAGMPYFEFRNSNNRRGIMFIAWAYLEPLLLSKYCFHNEHAEILAVRIGFLRSYLEVIYPMDEFKKECKSSLIRIMDFV